MILRAKAPLRISFCGGGTDVSPYPEQKGGVVLSTTIDKYVYASLRTRGDRKVSLTSLDYGVGQIHACDSALPIDGDLDLLKGVVNHFRGSMGEARPGARADSPADSICSSIPTPRREAGSELRPPS